jgi:DMSO/TMAO reductase YedYZ heme-binding membrane subunit
MKRRYLAAAAALAVPILLIAGLTLFSWQMAAMKREWQDFGQHLSVAQVMALHIADLWAELGWYAAPGLLLAGIVFCALFIVRGTSRPPGGS